MTIDPTDFGSIEDSAEFAEFERDEEALAQLIAEGFIGRPVVAQTPVVEDDINF